MTHVTLSELQLGMLLTLAKYDFNKSLAIAEKMVDTKPRRKMKGGKEQDA